MPEEQAGPAQALRTPPTIASCGTTIELGDNGLYHQAATLTRLDDRREVRQHPHDGGPTHQVDVLPPVQGDMVSRATRGRDLLARGLSARIAEGMDHGQRH